MLDVLPQGDAATNDKSRLFSLMPLHLCNALYCWQQAVENFCQGREPLTVTAMFVAEAAYPYQSRK